MKKLEMGENLRIAFLGDSITEGCFEAESSAEDDKYVYHSRLIRMLEEKYPKARIEKINAGVGGDIAGMGLFRLQKDVIDKKPDLAVVCFGVNDTAFCFMNRLTAFLKWGNGFLNSIADKCEKKSFEYLKGGQPKEAYTYALDEIFRQLKDKGIETILLLPNSVCSKPKVKENNAAFKAYAAMGARFVKNGTMDTMMNAARNVAAKHHVPVADAYTRWKEAAKNTDDEAAMFANGFNHPNRELHQILADAIYICIMNRSMK
jgi:lysophospholipase L1-like esterase